MTKNFFSHYARQYDSHLKHLKLKGLQPKAIDAYARAIRRLGAYFDYRIDSLVDWPSVELALPTPAKQATVKLLTDHLRSRHVFWQQRSV